MAPIYPAALKKKKRVENGHKSEPISLPVSQPTRVGFGEYFHPTLFDKATLYARLEFIGKIEELAQTVLTDLAQSVRPDYEQLRNVTEASELLLLNAEMLRHFAHDNQHEFAPLWRALEAWIKRHNLDADWVRDMALRTLFHWTGRIVASRGIKLHFSAPILPNLVTVEEAPFVLSDFGWIITNETRKAFVARITAEFNSYLAGYLRRVENRAKETGWIKTPQIRKSEKDSDAFRHFEWLVRWQCQQWTTTKIAKEYGLGNPRKPKSAKGSTGTAAANRNSGQRSSYAVQSDRRRKAAYQSVRDGLEKASNLIGLPLRAAHEGGENNLSQ